MKFKISIVLCMLLCMVNTPNYYSQVTVEQTGDDKYVRVMLFEGDVYDGFLIEITEETILIETEMLGKMRFNKRDVSQCFEIIEEELGEFEEDNSRFLELNLQKTRYFYSPSGHQLKKGQGYTHNMYVLYNSMSYGINDYLTAGVVLTPFGAGATLKAGVSANESISVSGGFQVLMPYRIPTYYTRTVTDFTSPILMGFGNMTFGTSKRNVTMNYGYATFDRMVRVENPETGESDISTQNTVLNMYSTAAMINLSSTSWFMFEGFFITQFVEDNDVNLTGLFIVGFRRASAKRKMLWDFGGVIVPEFVESSGMILPMPFVGLTLPL